MSDAFQCEDGPIGPLSLVVPADAKPLFVVYLVPSGELTMAVEHGLSRHLTFDLAANMIAIVARVLYRLLEPGEAHGHSSPKA